MRRKEGRKEERRGSGISVEMRPSIAISIRARKGIASRAIDRDRARQFSERASHFDRS
jgi:hypothetical protein